MNFFETELQNIVRQGAAFSNAKYAGSACYGQLDEDLRIKLRFTTRDMHGRYEGIKATILNRTDGQVDNAVFWFADKLGVKQVSNTNFRNGIAPYAWTSNGKTEWYVYKPDQSDYQQLCNAINEYCSVFQSQEMTDSPQPGGPAMSM